MAAVGGAGAAAFAGVCSARHAVELAVADTAGMALAALVLAVGLEARRRVPRAWWLGVWPAVRDARRQYAGFLIHLGLFTLALGVAGSSLRSQETELVLREGPQGPGVRCGCPLRGRAPDQRTPPPADWALAGGSGTTF